MMTSLTRTALLVSFLLAATYALQAQTVRASQGVAKLTLEPLPPFTVSCQVTDIPAGYKVLYPDLRQAALAEGRQSLFYKTVSGGEEFTVERGIEETATGVRITDSFPEEAAGLQLAKVLIVEFKGEDVADAVLEFIDGNKADAGGQRCSEMVGSFRKWGGVTCSGIRLTYPAGEKLVVAFEEPTTVSAHGPVGDEPGSYSFRLAYPESPSKSTFAFHLEGKGK